MRRLLAFKLKSAKMVGTLTGPLQEVLSESDTQVDISTNQLTLGLNKFEHAGTTIFAKLLFLSPELKEEHVRIRTLHNFSHEED